MNVSGSQTCGSNLSTEWTLVSPLCSTRYESVAVLVAVAVTLSLITLWTILGNIMVLVALCKYGSLRTMSNCLIGNLAISDLLLALTVLPVSTGHDLLGYWVHGERWCTVWLCIDVLYCTASVWGLCTVAFDRYMATVYPVWYHDKRSEKKAIACIVFVWIFSIIVSLAPFIGWQHMIPNFFTYRPSINKHECVLFTSSSYVIYSATSSFVIPACLMGFMYARIFMVLHTQSKSMKKKVSTCGDSLLKSHNGTLAARSRMFQHIEDTVERDCTTTTLLSVAGEKPGFDDTDNGHLETPTDGMVQFENVSYVDSVTEPDCHEVTIIVPLLHQNGQLPSTLTVPPAPYPGRRSNSLAGPSDGLAARMTNAGSLSVDLDRRNSHHVTMQRSASEVGMVNSGRMDFLLGSLSHRSKSANALSLPEREREILGGRGGHPAIPRRSLPCNIAKIKRRKGMTMSMKRRFQLREQRATKRMLLIMICFCVCWMPFLVMYVTRSVCDHCHMNHHLVAAIIWLGYVNSSLNPVLYTLFNDDFKGAFKELIGCKISQQRRRPVR